MRMRAMTPEERAARFDRIKVRAENPQGTVYPRLIALVGYERETSARLVLWFIDREDFEYSLGGYVESLGGTAKMPWDWPIERS